MEAIGEIVRANKLTNINFYDEQGNSLLHYTTQKDDLPLLKLLVRNGGNVNAADRHENGANTSIETDGGSTARDLFFRKDYSYIEQYDNLVEKVKQQTEILIKKAASDDLAEMEFSGHHKWATIQPKRNEITNSHHKFLDTLARLLTEKSDVCVSSNEDQKKVYHELVWLSLVKQVYSLTMEKVREKVAVKEKKKLAKDEEEVLDRLKDFEETVRIYKDRYHHLKDKNQSLLNELLEKDINMVVNAIVFPNELNKPEKIIDAIKEGKVEYVEGGCCKDIKEDKNKEKKDRNYRDYESCTNYRSKKECAVCEKNAMHAEMKIISQILEKKGLPIEIEKVASSAPMEIEEVNQPLFEYIGISKLVCTPCQLTIEVLNPQGKENKQEILRRLKELRLYEKVVESTSEVPHELAKID
ncbi:916_t:CDS:2 [Cetraspora pellucida]|uniref:916_t:CDS:1 n=1 Tax=Cetraspora pellucida TaxID=1433469 RepID=A0ACA9K6S5_9GLOM|nr:916_t:CDS:2 [Cetraspora pellucida]